MHIIDNIELANVEYFTDLGVAESINLLWDNHICKTVKRSTGFHSPRNVQLSFYKTLVRSKIEYASPLWSPNPRRYIILVEFAQRSFTIMHLSKINK